MGVAVPEVASALRALASPHRLDLVLALRQRERCVRDLVDATGLSQPLVSHHLARLAEAGLVTSRQAEGYTYYALSASGLRRARCGLDELLAVDDLPPAAQPGGGHDCCR